MKCYNGTHWDVMIVDETAVFVPKEERLIKYYFPDQEIPVKFTFNGEEIIPDTKEKENMGEDKLTTKDYHVIEEKGKTEKIEPLGEGWECSFSLSSASISDDFYKGVLGINPPKSKSDMGENKDCFTKEKLEKLIKLVYEQPILVSPGYISSQLIVGYDYTKDEENNIAITTIYWADTSTTTCRAPLDKADQYTGFMIAIAKYVMGNNNEATNTADYWINKRPAQLAREREKVEAEEAEIKRIADKRRKRKEQYRLRIAAIRRKEAYEAAKLANEKYGVPLNFKEDGEDK